MKAKCKGGLGWVELLLKLTEALDQLFQELGVAGVGELGLWNQVGGFARSLSL